MSILQQGLQRYFSTAELRILEQARIGIAGAGGLGSNVAMLLARSGIRHFTVVDNDRVEASNLNRQQFFPEDIGRLKVEALQERLLALEPETVCDCRPLWLEPENACALFAGCAIVVEALDEARIKAALCSALLDGGFYVVAASGLGGLGLPPMRVRRIGERFVCVGDFSTGVDEQTHPFAPRVAQAAALQAEAVLARLLGSESIL